MELLELGNNSDINNFVIIFTNTEFLFDRQTDVDYKTDSVKFGFSNMKILSNLFTNITKNINCINLGLLYFYILKQKNYFVPMKYQLKNNQEKIFYINFPNDLIQSMDIMQRQILFYFFTSNSLKEVDKKLQKMVNFEMKIHEFNQKDRSISINTSHSSLANSSEVDYKNN